MNLVDAWVGGISRWFRASRAGCPGEMIRFRLRVPGRSLCSLHVAGFAKYAAALLLRRQVEAPGILSQTDTLPAAAFTP